MKYRFTLLLLILGLGLCLPAPAQELFVRNRPFKGPTVGLGSELSLSLPDLAEALEVSLEEGEQGWILGGEPIKTRTDGGQVWVRLEDLPQNLVQIERSQALGTLDIYLREATQSTSGDDWGSDSTLVYFYAPAWCPVSQAMRGTFDQFQRSRRIRMVPIDIDQPKSRNFKKYVRLFEGDRIPYYVLLNREGRKVHAFSGFKTYKQLLEELQPFF